MSEATSRYMKANGPSAGVNVFDFGGRRSHVKLEKYKKASLRYIDDHHQPHSTILPHSRLGGRLDQDHSTNNAATPERRETAIKQETDLVPLAVKMEDDKSPRRSSRTKTPNKRYAEAELNDIRFIPATTLTKKMSAPSFKDGREKPSTVLTSANVDLPIVISEDEDDKPVPRTSCEDIPPVIDDAEQYKRWLKLQKAEWHLKKAVKLPMRQSVHLGAMGHSHPPPKPRVKHVQSRQQQGIPNQDLARQHLQMTLQPIYISNVTSAFTSELENYRIRFLSSYLHDRYQMMMHDQMVRRCIELVLIYMQQGSVNPVLLTDMWRNIFEDILFIGKREVQRRSGLVVSCVANTSSAGSNGTVLVVNSYDGTAESLQTIIQQCKNCMKDYKEVNNLPSSCIFHPGQQTLDISNISTNKPSPLPPLRGLSERSSKMSARQDYGDFANYYIQDDNDETAASRPEVGEKARQDGHGYHRGKPKGKPNVSENELDLSKIERQHGTFRWTCCNEKVGTEDGCVARKHEAAKPSIAGPPVQIQDVMPHMVRTNPGIVPKNKPLSQAFNYLGAQPAVSAKQPPYLGFAQLQPLEGNKYDRAPFPARSPLSRMADDPRARHQGTSTAVDPVRLHADGKTLPAQPVAAKKRGRPAKPKAAPDDNAAEAVLEGPPPAKRIRLVHRPKSAKDAIEAYRNLPPVANGEPEPGETCKGCRRRLPQSCFHYTNYRTFVTCPLCRELGLPHLIRLCREAGWVIMEDRERFLAEGEDVVG